MKARDRDRLWSLTPAVIALLGVVVGAMLAGGFDYLRDTRRDSQDFRQAKRLVSLELMRLGTEISGTAQANAAPRSDRLKTAVFESKADVLAKYLPDEDWTSLELFYLNVETMRAWAKVNSGKPSKREAADLHELVGFADQIRDRLGAEPLEMASAY